MERIVEVHIYPHGNITWQFVGEQICPPGAAVQAIIRVDFSNVPEGSGVGGEVKTYQLVES